MSEYTTEHSVTRLLGAPPSYVGYDEGGQLTEAVRTRRYAVVLFDEIEKAHPRVLSVLLQLLDEGRLTDGKGVVVDFSSTLVIMTSNLGTRQLLHAVSSGAEDASSAQGHVMEEIRSFFAPEFLNRLDEVIVFNPLSESDLRAIFKKQVNQLAETVLAETECTLVVVDDVADLALEGTDVAFGARPLQRYLDREVTNAVSRMLISGEAVPGSTIRVYRRGSELHVEVDASVHHSIADEKMQ
eukprot:gnl/Dysnectes_brevis/1262_a1412_1897.p1 GENE.gnl/Dysnectes_brevis/1262_a1412_1897~~gnl/Dysnectes_brevis/1262_a1412_1897.p1  ORF type:complete len:241 (+),score=68.56 gnl/Dysnectes_brevis/1262_a1412_1897:1528-2250(+)